MADIDIKTIEGDLRARFLGNLPLKLSGEYISFFDRYRYKHLMNKANGIINKIGTINQGIDAHEGILKAEAKYGIKNEESTSQIDALRNLKKEKEDQLYEISKELHELSKVTFKVEGFNKSKINEVFKDSCDKANMQAISEEVTQETIQTPSPVELPPEVEQPQEVMPVAEPIAAIHALDEEKEDPKQKLDDEFTKEILDKIRVMSDELIELKMLLSGKSNVKEDVKNSDEAALGTPNNTTSTVNNDAYYEDVPVSHPFVELSKRIATANSKRDLLIIRYEITANYLNNLTGPQIQTLFENIEFAMKKFEYVGGQPTYTNLGSATSNISTPNLFLTYSNLISAAQANNSIDELLQLQNRIESDRLNLNQEQYNALINSINVALSSLRNIGFDNAIRF